MLFQTGADKLMDYMINLTSIRKIVTETTPTISTISYPLHNMGVRTSHTSLAKNEAKREIYRSKYTPKDDRFRNLAPPHKSKTC